MSAYPEMVRLVDVAQAMADGGTAAVFDDRDEELGPVEHIRFLDYPAAEYLVAGEWRQASAFDLLNVRLEVIGNG